MSQQALSFPTLIAGLSGRAEYLTRPLRLVRGYERVDLRYDLVAAVSVAVLLLPQALVFAVMAGLPPQMGLYTAVVAGLIAALWGSSNQLQTGPTNTAALLVLSTVLPLAALGSPEYLAAAGVMAVLVGLLRLGMGLLRLGILVNFVSDSVIVGFAAGGGILIITSQLRGLLRVDVADSALLVQIAKSLAKQLPQTHLPSLALGLGTIAIALGVQRFRPRWPGALIAILLSGAAVYLFDLTAYGIRVIGEVQGGLPPLAKLPLLNLQLIGDLSIGALVVAIIGLVEVTSVSRAIATQTGQRLDSNQEFVGQGLASLFAGLFSGFVPSGSINRSMANLQAGAHSPVASAGGALLVLVFSTFLAPAIAEVPRASLAGLIMVSAINMINTHRIRRIWRSDRIEAAIMTLTLVSTLLLPLQFAVLAGILASVAYYLLQTSTPRVVNVLPDEHFEHFVPAGDRPPCPQMAVTEILGDVYFGAAQHVEAAIVRTMVRHPDQRFLLLRMHSVQQIDITGIYMLESVLKKYRERGGDIFLVKVRPLAREVMESSGFEKLLGEDHLLREGEAIPRVFYHALDPAVCIYECPVRAFQECQNLPKPALIHDITQVASQVLNDFATVSPKDLHEALHSASPPLVIDVREPREFHRGHVPQAQNVTLRHMLEEEPTLPRDRMLVLVCRSGRRSRRAAYALRQAGYTNLRVLEGGLAAWEAASLLEAIEEFV